MGNKLSQLMDRFKALPPAGKVAVCGGVGLGCYWLVKVFQGGSDTVDVTGENDGVIYYPYATGSDDLSFTEAGDSGLYDWYLGGGGSSGAVTSEEFQMGMDEIRDYVNNMYYEGPGSLEVGNNGGYSPGVPVVAPGQVDTNQGYSVVSGTEGINRYSTKYYADGTTEIYKNGVLVPEENYQYIPQEYGGTRTTGSGLTQKANQDLYNAQVAYQKAYNAGDRAAMAKAEAAGQAARKAGATEAGADAIWKANASSSKSKSSGSSSSKTNSSSGSRKTASNSSGSNKTTGTSSNSANQALHKAQTDYMNAYNRGDKAGMAAASKAGEAARKQGATDAGADAIWKANARK